MTYKIVAARIDDVTIHDYDEDVVLWQGLGQPHERVRLVQVNAKKLYKALGKHLKRKKHAR